MLLYKLMESKRAVLFLALAFLLVMSGTVAAALFVRGYRPRLNQRQLGLQATGLLVASSVPEGASVYLNDKLVTATNDTLNLPPGEYQVRLEKDGYIPWQKRLLIKKEIVTQTNAVLFRSAPDLRPLTNTGALKPTLSPNRTKIVYGVTQASSARKNGVWLLDLNSSLPLTRANTRQLTSQIEAINWDQAEFIWSPDAKTVLLLEHDKDDAVKAAYLIATDKFTPADQLPDVSLRLEIVLNQWRAEAQEELEVKLAKAPAAVRQIATQSAQLIRFSPDEERFFYLATASAQIPANLIPHPPARSTQPEERQLKPDQVYVYDLKEDTNFRLGPAAELGINTEKCTKSPQFQCLNSAPYWLDDHHLLFIDQSKSEIKIIEADATNRQTVYAGPFENSYIFPSPSGKSLIILTSLHPDSPGNLYEVRIR